MSIDCRPKPGMIGLCSLGGVVGKGVRVAQFLNGNGFSKYEHAFLYLGNGIILEAMPGGAQIVSQHHTGIYWCENIYGLLSNSYFSQAYIHMSARLYQGIPYSFIDYVALTLHRFHINPPGLQDFISDSGHMICSQLVDDYYRKILHTEIFTDDRWEGDVTPGALWQRDLELAV